MPIYESGTKYLSEELLNFYTTQHMMVNSLDFNYTYQAYLIWVSLLISDHGPSLHVCNSCFRVNIIPQKNKHDVENLKKFTNFLLLSLYIHTKICSLYQGGFEPGFSA